MGKVVGKRSIQDSAGESASSTGREKRLHCFEGIVEGEGRVSSFEECSTSEPLQQSIESNEVGVNVFSDARLETACSMDNVVLYCKDPRDGDIPFISVTYQNHADIYEHLRHIELKRRPSPDFLESKQLDIAPEMRSILVDWLIEVAEEYNMLPDTLHLACFYIDQYLSFNKIQRGRLQLLGVTCILIAAKFEEICAPVQPSFAEFIDDFCYTTDNSYSRREVLEMEREVLGQLHFDLSAPTTWTFLRGYMREVEMGSQLEFLGSYLAELTLLDYGFIKYLPSHIAASVLFLAKRMTEPDQHPWGPALTEQTGYLARELKDCVIAVHQLHSSSTSTRFPAIRNKYSQAQFQSVAELEACRHLPPSLFDELDQ